MLWDGVNTPCAARGLFNFAADDGVDCTTRGEFSLPPARGGPLTTPPLELRGGLGHPSYEYRTGRTPFGVGGRRWGVWDIGS